MAALAALWGASYLFIKVALDDLSPVALVFVRCALGALVLIPVALRRGAFAAARAHLGTLALIAAASPCRSAGRRTARRCRSTSRRPPHAARGRTRRAGRRRATAGSRDRGRGRRRRRASAGTPPGARRAPGRC